MVPWKKNSRKNGPWETKSSEKDPQKNGRQKNGILETWFNS